MRSARRRSCTVIPLKPFLHQRAKPDQPVVDADRVQKQQDDDRQEDPARNAHVITP